jgi:hypothetical protein
MRNCTSYLGLELLTFTVLVKIGANRGIFVKERLPEGLRRGAQLNIELLFRDARLDFLRLLVNNPVIF